MSELHEAALGAVVDANEVVLDAEERTQRWVRQRSYLAREAHLNGVSIEEIANRVKQSPATVREWLGSAEQ